MNIDKFKKLYKLNLRNYLKVTVIDLYLLENFFRCVKYNSFTSSNNEIFFDSCNLLVSNGIRSQSILKNFNLFVSVNLEDSLHFFNSFINYFNFLGYSSLPHSVDKVFSNKFQFDYNLKNFFRVKKRLKHLPSLYLNRRKTKIKYKNCNFYSFSKNNFRFFFIYLIFYYKLYFWNFENDQTNLLFLKSSLLNTSSFSIKCLLNDLNEEFTPYFYKSLVDFNFTILMNLHFEKRFGYELILIHNSILKIF